MTGNDGLIGIDHAARDQAGEKCFGALLRALGRKWAGTVAVAGQVRHENAQVLLCEAGRDEGHDLFIGNKTGKEENRSLWRTVLFLKDGSFEAATASRDEVGFLGIRFRKRQPETYGDKNNSGDGV